MSKERKCLKFTGYLYLPDENSQFNDLRYYSARTPGRLIIYDEHGERPKNKAIAFDRIGDMISHIEKEKIKRTYKKVKRIKK
jgi:hypothetical protein